MDNTIDFNNNEPTSQSYLLNGAHIENDPYSFSPSSPIYLRSSPSYSPPSLSYSQSSPYSQSSSPSYSQSSLTCSTRSSSPYSRSRSYSSLISTYLQRTPYFSSLDYTSSPRDPPGWYFQPYKRSRPNRPDGQSHDTSQTNSRSESDKVLEFGINVAVEEMLTSFNSNQNNVVCSPLSLTIVLSMLVPGAKGPTLDQLLGVFKCDSVDELNSKSLKLVRIGEAFGDDYNCVCLANGLFFDELFRLKPDYEETITNNYDAKIVSVDFSNKRKLQGLLVRHDLKNQTNLLDDEAEKKINEGWGNRVTNERMRDLLPIKLNFLKDKNVSPRY